MKKSELSILNSILNKRKYNPFSSKVIKRKTVGTVKCYIKEIRPNPKDIFGTRKADGMWYNDKGRNCAPSYSGAMEYRSETVYYYEVGANDGSYRKCASIKEAQTRFAQLIEFEKRQMQVK